ncbi:MAG: hypothetical protein LBC87_09115 [Fibromonadaceae bacterium]|jgi:uncharacterized protein (TIGR02145 family)|nr:hypothetical protein [Fibromonadaceae bacterium]
MRTQFSKFALVAALGLALTFTLSCSGGGGGDGDGGGTSSPSGGGAGSGGSCPNAVIGNGTVSCGGQTYKTVKIGSQNWMAENLNYTITGSKCGTDITFITDDGRESYELSDANTTYCDKYGRLYDWSTAMGIDAKYNTNLRNGSDVKHRGICPSGWHLPNIDDWKELTSYVENNSGCSYCAGAKLKAKGEWDYDVPPSTDEFRFSALPGGEGSSSLSSFGGAGSYGVWWSASEHTSLMSNIVRMEINDVFRSSKNKSNLSSVRCVQDD